MNHKLLRNICHDNLKTAITQYILSCSILYVHQYTLRIIHSSAVYCILISIHSSEVFCMFISIPYTVYTDQKYTVCSSVHITQYTLISSMLNTHHCTLRIIHSSAVHCMFISIHYTQYTPISSILYVH